MGALITGKGGGMADLAEGSMRHGRLAHTMEFAAGAVLVLATPILTWWLVGDQSTCKRDSEPRDFFMRPLSLGRSTQLMIEILSIIAAVCAITVLARRRGAFQRERRWIGVIAPLMGAGVYLGWAWRVITAEVCGANIGAGLVIWIGVPLGISAILWSTWYLVQIRKGASPSEPGAGDLPRALAKQESFGKLLWMPFAAYGQLRGRASRTQFWCFTMFYVGLAILSSAALSLVAIFSGSLAFWLSNWPEIILLAPVLAAATRRLHDVGRSGWWLAVAVVTSPLDPLSWSVPRYWLGAVPTVAILIFCLWPGQPRPNAYGPPLRTRGTTARAEQPPAEG